MARNDATLSIGVKDRTKAGLKSVSRGLNSLRGTVLNVQSGIAALVGVGGMGALITSSFRAGDALAKTADKLGTTTEALTGLRFAAELTGVKSGQLDIAMQRLTRRLAEAAETGSGPAADSLTKLGLSAEQLLQMPLEAQMGAIGDAMQGLGTQAERVKVAFSLFDTEGVNLVNTLADGSRGLREARDEAEALGLVLSRVETGQMEQVNDAVFKMGQVVRGVSNRIAVNLAPYISGLADHWLTAAKGSKSFDATVRTVIDNMLRGVGMVADAWQYMKVVWQGLKVAFAAMNEFILEGVYGIAEGVRELVDLIPGINLEPMDNFRRIVLEAKQHTAEMRSELAELSIQEMPSDNIQQWAQEVKIASVTAAKAVAKVNEQTGKAATMGAVKEGKNRVKLEKEVNKHIANSKKTLASQAIGLLRILGQENKAFAFAALAVEKGLAIAQATVNTAVAVTKAYTVDPTGALAARVAAIGKLQIALIAATGLAQAGQIASSGGEAGTIQNPAFVQEQEPIAEVTEGGETTVAGETAAAPAQTNVTINIEQGVYDDGAVIALVEKINELSGDGLEVRATVV